MQKNSLISKRVLQFLNIFNSKYFKVIIITILEYENFPTHLIILYIPNYSQVNKLYCYATIVMLQNIRNFFKTSLELINHNLTSFENIIFNFSFLIYVIISFFNKIKFLSYFLTNFIKLNYCTIF